MCVNALEINYTGTTLQIITTIRVTREKKTIYRVCVCINRKPTKKKTSNNNFSAVSLKYNYLGFFCFCCCFLFPTVLCLVASLVLFYFISFSLFARIAGLTRRYGLEGGGGREAAKRNEAKCDDDDDDDLNEIVKERETHTRDDDDDESTYTPVR